MRIVTLLLLIFSLTFSVNASAADGTSVTQKATKKKPVPKPIPAATALMTQRDLAQEMVKLFGWEGGLSEEPVDREYLVIMEGRRNLRFEAEKIFNDKVDTVVLRNHLKFGQFTGESWIGGISRPTSVHLKLFIPIAGEYTLKAAVAGNSQVWKIGGKEYAVNPAGRFTETMIATIPLKAGELEFEMVLPPDGALDYILFSAPDFNPITPLGGWRFNEKLTRADVAGVMVSFLSLEDNLPDDKSIPPQTIIASELKGLPSPVVKTEATIFGPFTGQKWLRGGKKDVDLEIPFDIAKDGVYGLKLRFMGATVDGAVDDVPFSVPGKPSIDWVDLGVRRLDRGSHLMRLTLHKHNDGLDILQIEPRKSSLQDYMELAGMSGTPDETVTYAEMEKILNALREKSTVRR